MIYFLTTLKNSSTILGYLRLWAEDLSPRIRVIAYEKLPNMVSAPPGTYVFTDFELLTPWQLAVADSLWEQLAAGGPAFRLLNRPRNWINRYDLLRRLSVEGKNDFNVHRATELDAAWRFPVFVRIANDHQGGRTPLLHNRQQVQQGILGAIMQGYDPQQVLIVEYVDTRSDDGLYRKYGVFRVGDRLVPRHVFFSQNWIQKSTDLIDPAKLAEERDYVTRNPHAEELRQMFDLSGIDYGRIDYGFYRGRLQVWEINTNPILLLPADKYKPEQIHHLRWFAGQIAPVLAALDSTEPGPEIPVRLACSLGSTDRL